ncbi:MAG: serine/threonine-protein kinase [Myxococcota bacterium]
MAATEVGPPDQDVLPRQFGKYTLLRPLAAGGMAKVYLAIQRAVAGFEKLVVIKRILPELARDPGFVEMLLTEARTAATLNHPNVVQTFDVGEVEGTYFIAMEHIDGEDIRSIVRAMKRGSVTEFPLEHTLQIVLGVCAGLSYAHGQRDLEGRPLEIVHRDISPQNILVTFTGDVKIVDFGIAKTSEAAMGEETKAGQLKGKVPYMSPEQARGNPIDGRSDIFSVGIMLFELTTGRRLFKAKSEFETLKLICEREYPRPSEIRPNYPPGLEAIVVKALAKDADERYLTASEMQADLEAFVREERIAASAVGLGRWMKTLFEDKIAEREATLQDVKQLADVIASQRTDELESLTSGGLPGHTTTTGLGISQTGVTAFPTPPAQKRSSAMVAAVAVAGVALGGIGLFVGLRSPSDATSGAVSPSGGAAPPASAPATPPAPTAATAPRGTLVLATDPPGAYVRIAGELQGDKTPTTVDNLPLDIDIEISFSLSGYESLTKTVRLSEAERSSEVSATLVKGSVTLKLDVRPRGALVIVDDNKLTANQTEVEGLGAGPHKVVVSAPGHLPRVERFEAKKGETVTLDIQLVPGSASAASPKPAPDVGPPGVLNVASRGGFCSNVLVNGRSVGPTPVAGISVKPGPCSIVCKTSDGRSIPSGASIKSGQTSRVTVSIPPP